MLHWRALRWSAWLGWQIDSNWAAPWLFLIYVLVKPLAGSLMLVCMYLAVRVSAGRAVAPEYLPFLYISSACFMLVGGITSGMSQVVVTDRESYGMLKFVRISPAPLRTYLIGRGLSRAIQACVGAVLTVSVGLAIFPELRAALDGRAIAWGWLLFYLGTGVALLVTLGLILAGAVLNMARYGMFLSDGIAGALYLFSGAAFPINILPIWLRPVSLSLPPTYWLEGMRRALLGPASFPSPLSTWDHLQLAVTLLVSTLVLGVLAHLFFR
ncbi:MAG TPA: ABC transporter permease, partial [Gemmataceae bacterium]|nr:ABC transporter permease [Gemmataceae bacterium]